MRKYITTTFAQTQKAAIRSADTLVDELRHASEMLGQEIGKSIVEQYFVSETFYTTPMDIKVSGPVFKPPHCVVITTKDDFGYIGKGISKIFRGAISAQMDFQGMRGIQALNFPIAHMKLPDPKGLTIDTLIVAKSVLATGCTAITLAKTAAAYYMPRNIVVASSFYSERGVDEITAALPNADLFLVGDPDDIDDNGMLIPGLGNIDLRLKGNTNGS